MTVTRQTHWPTSLYCFLTNNRIINTADYSFTHNTTKTFQIKKRVKIHKLKSVVFLLIFYSISHYYVSQVIMVVTRVYNLLLWNIKNLANNKNRLVTKYSEIVSNINRFSNVMFQSQQAVKSDCNYIGRWCLLAMFR